MLPPPLELERPGRRRPFVSLLPCQWLQVHWHLYTIGVFVISAVHFHRDNV